MDRCLAGRRRPGHRRARQSRDRDSPSRARAEVARRSVLPGDGERGMSLLRAYGWEMRKLARQKRTWAGLGAAMLYALAFVIALSVKKHAGIPPDIPLARYVT